MEVKLVRVLLIVVVATSLVSGELGLWEQYGSRDDDDLDRVDDEPAGGAGVGLDERDEISEDSLDRFAFFRRVKKLLPNIIEMWREFKRKYHPNFKLWEGKRRFLFFAENSLFIKIFNAGNHKSKVKMNKFGCMSKDEYLQLLGTMDSMDDSMQEVYAKVENGTDTSLGGKRFDIERAEVNWIRHNVVAPIQDQGPTCGSCYTFATAGVLESHRAIKYNKPLVKLSEQTLLDCSYSWGNSGCHGGTYHYTMSYLKQRPIGLSGQFPYQGKRGVCKLDHLRDKPEIKEFMRIPEGDELTLSHAVFYNGPVAVAVDASLDSFKFHHGPVYYDSACSSTKVNHAVVVVGIKAGHEPMYIIRNSWGEDWGSNGYFYLPRFKNNRCGVASLAYFPVV